MGIEKVYRNRINWEDKKNDLLKNIDRTIEEGRNVDPEILEIMREMLETARIKVSMKDYFGEED